jgi:hypothetical protein
MRPKRNRRRINATSVVVKTGRQKAEASTAIGAVTRESAKSQLTAARPAIRTR